MEKRSDQEEDQTFLSPWHFSDVVLVVEDTQFHVHKSTLSMWSPVFEAMFTLQFLESKAKGIQLPGKRKDEVEDLLRLMYSSNVKQRVHGMYWSIAWVCGMGGESASLQFLWSCISFFDVLFSPSQFLFPCQKSTCELSDVCTEY